MTGIDRQEDVGGVRCYGLRALLMEMSERFDFDFGEVESDPPSHKGDFGDETIIYDVDQMLGLVPSSGFTSPGHLWSFVHCVADQCVVDGFNITTGRPGHGLPTVMITRSRS